MRTLESITMLISDPKHADNDIEVYVDGYVDYHEEKEFGKDADGNRGVKRIFIDDVTEVSADDEDGDDVDLTEAQVEEAKESLGMKFFEG